MLSAKTLITTVVLVCMPLAAYANTPPSNIATIEGKIVEVVPSKKEIYVRNDSGKHEFYFNQATTVKTGESAGTYSDLKTGQQVKVTANKIGKRFDPISVEIVE